MNFGYKYHQNRFKNGEVMGIQRIQNGQYLAAILNIQLVFRIFSTSEFVVINITTASVFQQICSFIHKENDSLKAIESNPLVCLLF